MMLTTRRRTRTLALAAGLGLLLAACGAEAEPDAEPTGEDASEQATADEEPVDEPTDDEASPGDDVTIVVTTSILGDIVETLAGDDATVTVIMPPGADPHGFQPSASDAAAMRTADLVIANGLDLEESLVSALAAAEEEGVTVFTVADKLDPIEFDWDGPGHSHGDDDHSHDDDGHAHDDDDGHSHDDDGHAHDDDDGHSHDDDGHAHDDDDGHSHGDDDDHGHDDEHDHGPEDPHVWLDPVRMADGVQLIAGELAAVSTSVDAAEWERRAQDYAEELLEIDEELVEMFAAIPSSNRQLVTNHDALGYLAVRYDFEVLGTVIPGATTQAEADAQSFAELVQTVEDAGVPAVFAENTDSTTLAEQLASEVVGRSDLEVEVVRLYTDALGEPGSGAETYPDLLRTNGELITDALS